MVGWGERKGEELPKTFRLLKAVMGASVLWDRGKNKKPSSSFRAPCSGLPREGYQYGRVTAVKVRAALSGTRITTPSPTRWFRGPSRIHAIRIGYLDTELVIPTVAIPRRAMIPIITFSGTPGEDCRDR